jgi:hypothetical protein
MLKGIFRFLAGKIIAIELAHSLMAYFIISLAFGPKLPACSLPNSCFQVA